MKLLICTQAADRDDPVLGFFYRWIEEFKKYRNFFYLLYVGVLVIFGILIMVKGVKHFTGQKLEKPKSSLGYEYILPAVIQGLILVTFSYAISGFLLDAFLILKNLFNNT